MAHSSRSRPRRDDPCKCGSRKKYANCCKPKDDRSRTLFFIAVVIGGVFLAKIFFGPAPSAPTAPAGKVWSEEHGHYHDAGQQDAHLPADGSGAGNVAPQGSSMPVGAAGQVPPPGEAPPGKVWSPEHGHWHDAPGAILPSGGQSAPAAPPSAQAPPPGQAPPGKVWSPEHGHWHDAPKP